MPVFSPRRYQPPFYPVSREDESLVDKVFTPFERALKGALFGCRMCGNCILQETAFICPMTCPKGLRNGLCGGATPERCEVDPTRPCTWYKIYERSEKMGRMDRLLEINAPIDGNNAGKETWLRLVSTWKERGKGPRPVEFVTNREKFDQEWDDFFYDVRQPTWWKGDSQYHPPTYDQPVSLLEANLKAGHFTVTAEISPPLGASGSPIEKKVCCLKGYVVAANFTDNASAAPRMNSMASSRICLDSGMEPIMQLQARDRSRVILEADALGAAGLGIHNILCLSGDHHRFGLSPMVKPDQFDMDAVEVLWMLRRMRDEGIYLDGREIKQRPMWFLGAAASPFGAPPKYEAIRAEKKINAGAQFIQTQPIFDYNRFTDWLEALDKRSLLDKVYILAGIVPLKSARAAHFMDEEVPGVVIPKEIVARMDAAGDKDGQQAEGIQITLELIEKVKNTPGLNGIHFMAVQWEEIVPKLVEDGHLPHPLITELPKPAPKKEKAPVAG